MAPHQIDPRATPEPAPGLVGAAPAAGVHPRRGAADPAGGGDGLDRGPHRGELGLGPASGPDQRGPQPGGPGRDRERGRPGPADAARGPAGQPVLEPEGAVHGDHRPAAPGRRQGHGRGRRQPGAAAAQPARPAGPDRHPLHAAAPEQPPGQPDGRLHQAPGRVPAGGEDAGHLRRGGRRGRGQAGARGGGDIPQVTGNLHPAGRAHAPRHPAGRASRHGQDAALASGGRRGRGALLLDERLGLRRDVRGRRRRPRARPLQARQEELTLHRIPGRDRRPGTPPRWIQHPHQRGAGADPQPAAGRDGRLHHRQRRGGDRGHQPAGRARPRTAALGPFRQAGGDRRSRSQRTPRHPVSIRRAEAARSRDRPGRDRPAYARLHRRRSGQPAQRGRHPGGAQRPPDDRDARSGRGQHAGDGGPGEEEPGHHRGGEGDHRLSRGGARAGDEIHAQVRSRAQGLGHLPGPGPGRDHPAAHPGPLPDLEVGAGGPHGGRDGRPGGRGDHLRRRHLGRQAGHRTGHQHRPFDGLRAGHEREAGAGDPSSQG